MTKRKAGDQDLEKDMEVKDDKPFRTLRVGCAKQGRYYSPGHRTQFIGERECHATFIVCEGVIYNDSVYCSPVCADTAQKIHEEAQVVQELEAKFLPHGDWTDDPSPKEDDRHYRGCSFCGYRGKRFIKKRDVAYGGALYDYSCVMCILNEEAREEVLRAGGPVHASCNSPSTRGEATHPSRLVQS